MPDPAQIRRAAFVAIHAGRHRFERLKWAVDVARLYSQFPQLRVPAAERASEWHARRCLDVAVEGIRTLGLMGDEVSDVSILSPLAKFPLMRFRYDLVERPGDKMRMLAGYVAPEQALCDERIPQRLALVAAPFRQLSRGIRRG
jgi:hypothetical protein